MAQSESCFLSTYPVGLYRETCDCAIEVDQFRARHANESLRARRRDWTAAANLPAAQEGDHRFREDLTQLVYAAQ